MMSSSTPTPGTYLYCVGYAQAFGKDTSPVSAPGIEGDKVRVVEYADLVALVSDSRKPHYEVSREAAMAHERVIEEAMARSDVLPAAFGMVASSDQEVEEKLLKGQSDELHSALAHIQGRIEVDLRVLWNQERLFAEIVEENDEIRALRDSLIGQPEDAVYEERIRLGELTNAEINRKREQEAESIVETLKPMVNDIRLNNIFSDMMILNAALLVDKTKEPEIAAKVEALAEAQRERRTFNYVGPLPPYNFVNIRLDSEE
jgi:hypothetical protein